MSTFGVVALSVFAGIFFVILIAGIGLMIYLTWKVHKAMADLCSRIQQFSAETNQTLDNHRNRLESITETSKSNLISIKQEMRQALESSHRTIQGFVEKIRGTELAAASARIIAAAVRFEKIAGALQDLVIESKAEAAEEANLIEHPWPDERANEYGPSAEGPSVYSKPRPDDVLDSQADEPERIPVGL